MKNIYILLCCFFNSCATMYVPISPNIPAFHGKKEFQTEAGLSLSGINLNTSYSPVKHIGILCNGHILPQSFVYNIDQKYDKNAANNHEYLEGLIGTYFNIKNRYYFELFLGYGIGIGSNHKYLDGYHVEYYFNNGKYNKYSCQLNIVYEFKNLNQIGLCNRFGIINYKIIDIPANKWVGNSFLKHNSWEPSVFYLQKINNKLKLSCYLGISTVSGDEYSPNRAPTIITNMLSAGVGLKLVLGRKENK